MTPIKRFIFQTSFWLALWLGAWLLLNSTPDFITEHALSICGQLVVIGLLIFVLAPKFLFQKKYLKFTLYSLGAIIALTFLTSFLNTPPIPMHGPGPENIPPLGGPGGPGGPGGGLKPPPKFFIQFLILTVAYVLATFIETFIFAQKQEEAHILSKNENLQTELKLLKSQINPHFLFNSLNNIYALSVTNSSKTQESISTLSNMLRYVLYECEEPFVPINKEISYIDNYLKLYCLKSSKTYPITTNFDGIEPHIKIPSMLFIPFVENALKHGNIEAITDAFLNITIKTQDDKVLFEVSNSFSDKVTSKDDVGGIGIENVKRRLAILYPKKHHLKITSDACIFKVSLEIEVN